jgi:hypothetical protein
VAEHDDGTAIGDELLREADRLRYGPVPPEPDPTLPLAAEATAPVAAATAPGPRLRDPGALLVGAWFAAAGIASAILGEAHLDDVPPVIVPVSFAVVGLGLLLPKRSTPRG